MRSADLSSEVGGGAQREAIAAAPAGALPQFGGNRAIAALIDAAKDVAVVLTAPPSPALDDPSFNPTSRAHDLVRAVDTSDYDPRFKPGTYLEDVEAERRKVDFATAVAALDGLTASQVVRVEQIFYEFDKSSLRDGLFGLGTSGRKADLKPDQVVHLQALMRGTKPEPIPLEVMAELRTYPPEIAGRLKADLERRADAGPALNRHTAEAAELHRLLAGDLDEGRRERVMALHRRSGDEIDAMDALYAKEFGKDTLAVDLNRRLTGLQAMRMTELREGNFAQADACAIEDKRRRIEELNQEDQQGYGVVADVLREQRKEKKQELTRDIQGILELNRQEALADPSKSAGVAVAERFQKILGPTLGEELNRTLGKEDAAVINAAMDPWNSSGSANLIRAAAAQLVADEKNGKTSSKRIAETLETFRKLAQHDLIAQAHDPQVPPAQKQALLADLDGAVTRLARRYIDDYRAEYAKLTGGQGRTYDQIVAGASDADEKYLGDLTTGGGQAADLDELEHAMGKRDVGQVKAILKRQPSGEQVDELVAAYQQRHPERDLRRELFGRDALGATASPELAQIGSSMLVKGGLVTGRDAAQVAEQLSKPAAGAGPEAEARWLAQGGRTEYDVTMDHRGATGVLREIGDDPETQRLLERTKSDLVTLGKQVEAEKDPAKRARLVAEMRRLRATLTGDADAYEKDNARVLGQIQSALSFAVSIALAVAIPGGGATLAAFLQTTAVNIAATVASNFVIKMGDYSLADLRADVLGGALGAGGAKFGEAVMGKVAAAVMRPAGEAAAEAAGKLGVQTALAHEVGALAAAGEKVIIEVEEFGVRAAAGEAATIAVPTAWEIGAQEVGGFFGGLYGPKVLTGDFSLSAEEVLQALAGTLAGKVAHRNKGKGATEEPAHPGEEAPQRKPGEGEAAPPPIERAVFHPEPVLSNADAFGPRSPKEMLLDSGIPPASAKGFQEVADAFNVVLKVRPTNTASLPVLDAGGVAKPELIKAKTVNRTDQLIGAPADGLGKVGFFDPKMPSAQILEVLSPGERQAVDQRFKQRAEEYAHYRDEYGKLQAEGLLKMADGVLQIADPRTGEFRDIGGDHDLFEITNADPNGPPLHPDVRRGIINQLRSMGINVEHGDHAGWKHDSPQTHDPAADAKIREQHETTEPLVAFVPKSQPRHVMAGDPVTGPARTEGVGDRFLPAATGTVIEPGPAGPERRPGETDFSVEPRPTTAEEIAASREREPSAMMGRSTEAPAGLEVEPVNYRMAVDLHRLRQQWAGVKEAHDRARMLVLGVAMNVEHTGVPIPTVHAVTGENSYFHPDVWLIEIGHPAIANDHPTTAQFAEMADHARHEMEHAVLEFRVARREAARSGETAEALSARLGIAETTAKAAIAANQGGFEDIANTPLDARTAAINESIRGDGARDRAEILARLEAAETALEQARARVDRDAATAIDEALEIYHEAHEAYTGLPDEALAWDAGRQVQLAVRQHQDFLGRMEAADKALGGAKEALEIAKESGGPVKKLRDAVGDAQKRIDGLLAELADRTGTPQP
ncbi:hypothetical protein BJ973_003707 [Actinoplanes tereljensis]|uniref:Uncharacterized protein n=1 Tax=Paractinoplanes tereljensis TaxID=571912 RepID=A0A919TYM3_9ACTN|nr:hypothetical protein [Actinoplanes tereljensis]GIF25430.1 hypothetical protein Ate02nite_81600 [Actinoplanes tereljensis]